MTRPFVCEACARRVESPYDRIVVRTEYRNAHTKARYRVTTDGRLCRSCVELVLDGPDQQPKLMEVSE